MASDRIRPQRLSLLRISLLRSMAGVCIFAVILWWGFFRVVVQ